MRTLANVGLFVLGVALIVMAVSDDFRRTATVNFDNLLESIGVYGKPCDVTICPGRLYLPSSKGNGGITVRTTSPCEWRARSDKSWITITKGRGYGNGTATFEFKEDEQKTRTGTITIGDEKLTLIQDGGDRYSYMGYTEQPWHKWFWVEIRDMLRDWPLGTLLGVILLFGGLLIVGLILWGMFVAMDSWFRPHNKKMGRVVDKTFTPAHTQMVYNPALKMSTPRFVDDEWRVSVEVDEKQDSIAVSESFYSSLRQGSPVLAEYVIGRLSRDIYLKDLFRA